MKNFYYVLSFNTTNPKIKSMFTRQSIFATSEQMIDLKARSRPYMSLTEVTIAAHKDAQLKLKSIFDDETDEHRDPNFTVNHVCVMNPLMLMAECGEIDQEAIAERFGPGALYNWDDNCCSAMFFLTNHKKINDASDISSDDWLLKYEVMYFSDSIEIAGNGDFVFAPSNINMSSALH